MMNFHGVQPHKTRCSNSFKLLVLIILSAFSFKSDAEFFSSVESRPASELWLNPGMFTYHFQRNKGLNERNLGPGVEYRYSTTSSVTLGEYNNSDRRTSHYAGWYWQPIALGPVRLGGVLGAIDGYPRMRSGDWFPAIIPTTSIEYGNFGANLFVIPSYQDKVYGAISLQLKFKVF